MSRKNIFTIHQDYEKKPDRNTFDLSFANNLTLKFGQLTPVFCKECVPGDSFRIKPSCALQFMPMAFPVQTPMRAYLHFFKTRNRTMWKDWMDFISGTKTNLVHPYVAPVDKEKFYRVGGLADYLGVPNVLYNTETQSNIESFPVIGAAQTVNIDDTEFSVVYNPLKCTNWVDYSFLHYFTRDTYGTVCYSAISDANDALANTAFQSFVQNARTQLVGSTGFSAFSNLNPNILPNPYGVVKTYNAGITDINDAYCLPWNYLGRYENSETGGTRSFKVTFSTAENVGTYYNRIPYILVFRNSENVITGLNGGFAPYTSESITGGYKVVFNVDDFQVSDTYTELYFMPPYSMLLSNSNKTLTIYPKTYINGTTVDVDLGVSTDSNFAVIGTGNFTSTPYDSDIRLNAFPFRAYECIYNAYYRNSVNDPFKPDGVTPEYNKFNTTYEGGADSTQYDLYYRNWEYDFLTSAVPTPQFGNAPLVGLTSTGAATLEDGNGNRFIVQAQLDSDGEITGWTTSKENDPSGSLRMLMNMATTGISINDLRNVNAYQRFLENAIRKGLSYRDQILAHYGVSVSYDELDMPEFIGGCSTFVDMNKINQLSEGGSTPLGSFVGQATAMMSGKHDITEYCDEHGFIIGILSIVPMPVYSQLLPKHFLHAEQLDYYFPEFKHVGYQPIAQKEVSPLQTYYTNGDLNKTFGYNRAYYDLIASTDEVHGQFRTTMRDFIMNRTFENEPVLGGDFLHVDPDQLNDVFLAGDLESSDGSNIYAADADKIIGSLYFDVQKKSPISLYGIAKLE